MRRQAFDDGCDPGDLETGVDTVRTGPGGLPAHVDDVGPLRRQRQPMGDGGIGIEVPATVGEGIGRHVDDAHDDGAHAIHPITTSTTSGRRGFR